MDLLYRSRWPSVKGWKEDIVTFYVSSRPQSVLEA